MKYIKLESLICRSIRKLFEVSGGFTLLVAFIFVLREQQYESFAKTIVPILATYIATAALLYNRGRALPKSPGKVRTLYAAERSVQATIFTLTGVVLGAIIFSFLKYFEADLSMIDSMKNKPIGPWLLVYLIPYTFILFGYIRFFSTSYFEGFSPLN
jgi:hypothetical protein